MRRVLTSISERRLATLASLLLLSAFLTAMIGARYAYSGEPFYGGLIWNLFLAWIPFGLALFVYDGVRRGRRRALLFGAALLWLLFFPNAPYIVTDFKHLRTHVGAPIWFDVVLLSTAAWGGLVLGFISLYLMQVVARRVVGALSAWLLVLGVLALSSFGIYLGRFERWNSWDVFFQPRALLGSIWRRLEDPLNYPDALGVTLLFTAFLSVTYLVFYSFARLTAAARATDRP